MFALGAGADLAALQHGVHFALSLIRLHVVLGRNLAHQVVLTLERRHILLGEFVPFRADVIENSLLVLCVYSGDSWMYLLLLNFPLLLSPNMSKCYLDDYHSNHTHIWTFSRILEIPKKI
jgi:hypothetical protein